MAFRRGSPGYLSAGTLPLEHEYYRENDTADQVFYIQFGMKQRKSIRFLVTAAQECMKAGHLKIWTGRVGDEVVSRPVQGVPAHHPGGFSRGLSRADPVFHGITFPLDEDGFSMVERSIQDGGVRVVSLLKIWGRSLNAPLEVMTVDACSQRRPIPWNKKSATVLSRGRKPN